MKPIITLVAAMAAAVIAGAASAQTFSQGDARLLASNCMQCHATNGQPRNGGAASLAGKTYSQLKSQLNDLAKKNPAEDSQKELMIVHARTYSPAEIDAIARSLSGQ